MGKDKKVYTNEDLIAMCYADMHRLLSKGKPHTIRYRKNLRTVAVLAEIANKLENIRLCTD